MGLFDSNLSIQLQERLCLHNRRHLDQGCEFLVGGLGGEAREAVVCVTMDFADAEKDHKSGFRHVLLPFG